MISPIIIIILTLHISEGLASRNVLISTNHCMCPGDTVSYECRIASEPEIGSTLWRGSALASQCPEIGGEIILRHRTFTQTRTCGNITGRGIGIEEDGYYTSQLNITVDSSMDNDSVECIYNNGTNTTMIGSSYIEILNMNDTYPPPNNTRVTQLDMTYNQSIIEVTLMWSPVVNDCSTQYLISSDCGLCPDTFTTNITTTITCSGWSAIMKSELYCSFAVRTSICNDSLIGTPQIIHLNLKAPDVPFVEVIPLYSYETNKLSMVTTVFGNQNSMINTSIYDTGIINAPVIHYTIEYIGISRNISRTLNIDIQDQQYSENLEGIQVCQHEYDNLSTFLQSAYHHRIDIIMSISATNVFGRGPAINTSIGCRNTFVKVIFHPKYTSVTCKFLALWSINNTLACNITYGNRSYKQQNTTVTGPGVSDTVTVVVTVMINATRVYQLPSNHRQFTIIATDDTSTVKIEGTFNITEGGSTLATENVNIAMFAAITTTVIVVGMAVILGLVLLFISKNKLKMLFEIQPLNNEMQSDPHQTDQYHEEHQFTTDTQYLGVYSLVGPTLADKRSEQTQGTYADVQVSNENAPCLYPMSDDRIQYAELNHNEMNKLVTTASTHDQSDESDNLKQVNLDNLLIQLREEVTPHWQNFGLIIGVPRKVIVKYSEYPPDQCMIEILDYWLRHHDDAPLTWRDVAVALRQIKLYQLAEKILKVYVIGQLPIIEIDSSTLHGTEAERECGLELNPPELPPKPKNWK